MQTAEVKPVASIIIVKNIIARIRFAIWSSFPTLDYVFLII